MTNESRSPAVSIIIPTFNRADHLPRAVDSVFSQTFEDFELIVLDDGSNDNTVDLLREWELAHPDQFRWATHPNMGQIRTVNRGFQMARGDYFYVLNSDDYIYPECLHHLVATLRAHPEAVISYGDYDVVDIDDEIFIRVTNEPMTTVFVIRNAIPTGAGVLYTRKVVEAVGGWDPDYPVMPDYAFWFQATFFGELVHSPHRVAVWRSHENTITVSSRAHQIVESYNRLYKAYFSDPRVPDGIREIEDDAWRSMYILCGQTLLDSKKMHEGRFYVLDSYARRNTVLKGSATIEEELLAWRDHAGRLQELEDNRRREVEAERAHAGRLEMVAADANRKAESLQRGIDVLTVELEQARRTTRLSLQSPPPSSSSNWRHSLNKVLRTHRYR